MRHQGSLLGVGTVVGAQGVEFICMPKRLSVGAKAKQKRGALPLHLWAPQPPRSGTWRLQGPGSLQTSQVTAAAATHRNGARHSHGHVERHQPVPSGAADEPDCAAGLRDGP